MSMRRLWLGAPVLLFCTADGLLTLYGQPDAYWSNGFTTIREGNPVAAWLLGVHPLAFVFSAIPYLALLALIVVALPRFAGAAVVLCVASAHAFAVGWWCHVLFERPALPIVTVILTLIGAMTLAWKKGLGDASAGVSRELDPPGT